MKNRISRKITIVNAAILISALLVFFILAFIIFNGFILRSIKNQLVSENKVTYRLAIANIINKTGREVYSEEDYYEPNIYSNLVDSISVILIQSIRTGEYELYYTSEEAFDTDIDISAIEKAVDESNGGVTKINIDSTDYFITLARSRIYGESRTQAVAISLIPLSAVKNLNRRFTFIFLMTVTVLVLLSILILMIFSRRMTEPILKLTNLAKQYSKRDFSNKYTANTNDEIEELSKSISAMAYSLEQQDEQRDKMFRNISHELKTPLTAIYGYAEGIKNGVFENTKEPLDIKMSESLRIKKLTEDIIYLSKLESHIEVFELRKSDISDIMIKAIQSIESIAIMKDIDIKYIPADIEKISVDEDKMHRALINILSNCVKYTNDLIEIDIKNNRDNVEIIISDNGSGFIKEDIDNLLSGMTKEKSNGSGIGLSIVNEIVSGHKGKFIIANKKTGGALFKITLSK